jgi:hypothetical protein
MLQVEASAYELCSWSLQYCNNAVVFELERGNSPRRLADDEKWSMNVMTYVTILMGQPE